MSASNNNDYVREDIIKVYISGGKNVTFLDI